MTIENALGSEVVAVVGTIDPDVTVASTVTSDAVDMALFDQVIGVVLAGTLGSSATIDAKLEQATTSGGSYKDVTGKAITQMTQAGTDQSDDQALINCRAEELDIANDYKWVRLSVTVAVATSDLGAVLLALGSHYAPASDNDLASVGEIIA